MDPQTPPNNDSPTEPPTPPPATDQPAEDTPAAPANDQGGSLPPDHPLTDSNVDEHDAYDSGVAGAAGADDPAASQGQAPVEDATEDSDTDAIV